MQIYLHPFRDLKKNSLVYIWHHLQASISSLCDTVLNFAPLARCHANEFRCKDGRCIELAKHCDGIDDCGQNEDEDSCGK